MFNAELASSYARHPELYFADGSVVLVCIPRPRPDLPTPQPTAFKVFRSLLAANSEVFSDVLSLDQPPCEEKYDGCPVIRLPDDAEDMECLLKATFFSKSVHCWLDKPFLTNCCSINSFISMQGPPPPWAVFFSILRLSVKYNFYGLHRGMLHHLEIAYPSSYEDYLARREPNRLGLHYWGIEPSPTILFQLINFIRGCHAVHCLPYAFYEACQLFVGDTITCQLEGNTPLSPPDFKAVVLGATALQQDEINLMRLIFTQSAQTCTCQLMVGNVHVRTPLNAVCHTMACALPSITKTRTSPLSDQSLSGYVASATGAFCAQCLEMWDQTWKEGKRQMWGNLPEYFDLPAWDVLLKEGRTVDVRSN